MDNSSGTRASAQTAETQATSPPIETTSTVGSLSDQVAPTKPNATNKNPQKPRFARYKRAEPNALVKNPTDLDNVPGYKIWKAYLKQKIGPPRHDMHDPHAHHILFKDGNGPEQKVKEGQAILRRLGIDSIYGLQNLVWAPNRVKGQHHIDTLKDLVEAFRTVEAERGGYNGAVAALKKLGRIAARRK